MILRVFYLFFYTTKPLADVRKIYYVMRKQNTTSSELHSVHVTKFDKMVSFRLWDEFEWLKKCSLLCICLKKYAGMGLNYNVYDHKQERVYFS